MIFLIFSPKFHALTSTPSNEISVAAAGYFLKVLDEGVLVAGNEVRLQSRPNPNLTLRKVSEGLWGPPGLLDNSREFLTSLAEMDCLLNHLFRNTAKERLRRLDEETGGSADPRERDRNLAKQDEDLAQYNLLCISAFMIALFAYFYFFGKKAQSE